MTRTVYVIGGSGSGKSTFVARLLAAAGVSLGPVTVIHSKRNPKNLVKLLGHPTTGGGLYLGVNREAFPGTDALDNAVAPVVVEWLEQGGAADYRFLVGEGATLFSTRRILRLLHERTDLLLVHLFVEDFVRELWFAERGAASSDHFVKVSSSAAHNRAEEFKALGARVLECDAADMVQNAACLRAAVDHLKEPEQ